MSKPVRIAVDPNGRKVRRAHLVVDNQDVGFVRTGHSLEVAVPESSQTFWVRIGALESNRLSFSDAPTAAVVTVTLRVDVGSIGRPLIAYFDLWQHEPPVTLHFTDD